MNQLRGTVIITGSTRGIGRATALKLAELGYRLVLNYHTNDADAAESYASCLEISADVELVKADVSIPSEAARLMEIAFQRFGSIDVLINNAGRNVDRPFMELTDEDWDTVIDTNMKGVFTCCRAAVPLMLRRETGGCIVNVGSTTAIRGRKNGLNYCASKAGVLTMTKCLALELAPAIRVNCIIPGLMDSQEARDRYRLDELDERRKRENEIPLGYIGPVEAIADAIAFIISPAARYITGQKLIVDGGQYMY